LSPIKKTAPKPKPFPAKHAFNDLLGIELVRTHRDGVTIQCRLRPDLMNGAGMLHGGVTASVADAAVGIALYHRFRGTRRFTTVELKVNYFKPVAAGVLVARSHLVRIGSTIVVGRVDMLDEEKRAVGLAVATYMFVDTHR
jgi:acyl-CoA thioesterase